MRPCESGGCGSRNDRWISQKTVMSPQDQPVYPVPQNAPHVSAGMNPERAGLSKESGSYGVNVLELSKGQRPKATDVSP